MADKPMEEGQGSADGAASEQGEQQEDAGLQQIAQIAQQGQQNPTPDGYAQILQIVQTLLAHNQQEEGEMGGGQAEPSSHEKMLSAVKKSMGQE